VGTQLEGKVNKDKASKEDLEGGPRSRGNEGVLGEPALGNLELLVHVLGKLEVEKGHFVSSEVACQFD